MRLRKVVVILVTLLVLAALALGIQRALTARKQQAELAAAPKAQTVIELAAGDTFTLQPVELTQILPVSGTLRSLATAIVKAKVAGEVRDLVVREGDSVRAGQVLARIDPVEYEAKLRQAQLQADAALAQIEIAQRQYDNNRALVGQGFISSTALDASDSTLRNARATHAAALAARDVARKALDDTVVRAPIDAQVSLRVAQPGERLAIDARVIELVDARRLELEAALATQDAASLRVGQQATLRVEGLDLPVKARVSRINPAVQAGSRNVLAYLAVEPVAGLRQGLYAQGLLEVGRSQRLAVPLAAMRTDKPQPYLQLVRDGRVVHQAVTPGLRGPRAQAGTTPTLQSPVWVEVDGVPADSVVLQGSVGALREGTAVKTAKP
jgi:RND family efflux transporter MFP subunit